MLTLPQILKDLLSKAKVVNNNISETYIKNLTVTEIERSFSSSVDESLYLAIKNAAFTNLPPKIGYGKEKTLTMNPVGGQLKVNVPSQAIYLGGFGSIVPAQTISLPANRDSYVYVVRDAADYTKVNFEIYDHLLGGKDKDIHFTRILCSRFKTDSSKVIEQESFETANYSCF